jgi:hypothetical protein
VIARTFYRDASLCAIATRQISSEISDWSDPASEGRPLHLLIPAVGVQWKMLEDLNAADPGIRLSALDPCHGYVVHGLLDEDVLAVEIQQATSGASSAHPLSNLHSRILVSHWGSGPLKRGRSASRFRGHPGTSMLYQTDFLRGRARRIRVKFQPSSSFGAALSLIISRVLEPYNSGTMMRRSGNLRVRASAELEINPHDAGYTGRQRGRASSITQRFQRGAFGSAHNGKSAGRPGLPEFARSRDLCQRGNGRGLRLPHRLPGLQTDCSRGRMR